MSAPPSRWADWFESHRSGFQGKLGFQEPLSRHTYYRIGGPADLLALPRSSGDLLWLSQGIQATQVPWAILGAGSNTLAHDEGFRGLVIQASKLNLRVSVKREEWPQAVRDQKEGDSVWAGASVPISLLLRRAAQEGWGGLDFLAGIPGSVGGVVTMNAGTHLGESISRLRAVSWVKLGDGKAEEQWTLRPELKAEYRRNLFLPAGAVVCSALWEIQPGEPAQVKKQMDEVLERRKKTQPLDHPSCGSVFKNPRESGLSAWQVMERLGLRGHQRGGAQFSPLHCNFIVNLGQARAEDVRGLIELAKKRALTELGIRLEEEVRYLGF